ncbi:hypothetical protein [Burkholderia sp. PU8-34]
MAFEKALSESSYRVPWLRRSSGESTDEGRTARPASLKRVAATIAAALTVTIECLKYDRDGERLDVRR